MGSNSAVRGVALLPDELNSDASHGDAGYVLASSWQPASDSLAYFEVQFTDIDTSSWDAGDRLSVMLDLQTYVSGGDSWDMDDYVKIYLRSTTDTSILDE